MFDDRTKGILPNSVGVGYKPQHFTELLHAPGPVEWLEVHAENYMGDGGRPLAQLEHLRERFALSVHGVGLSIGGEMPLDLAHLARLKKLCDRINPAQFSEHLAWSTHDGAFLNDLLPLPYTAKTLNDVVTHIDEVQSYLGRQILLENPSSYLAFSESTYEEPEFLSEIARRSGCGLLLDVNNVFVSATNLQFTPQAYINAFALDLVGEVHLGGHHEERDEKGQPLLIDSHGAPVADPVWALYSFVLDQLGAIPTLVEWDNDVPDWHKLRAEAQDAQRMLARVLA